MSLDFSKMSLDFSKRSHIIEEKSQFTGQPCDRCDRKKYKTPGIYARVRSKAMLGIARYSPATMERDVTVAALTSRWDARISLRQSAKNSRKSLRG